MASTLVDEVRTVLRTHDRPLTARERALLMATVMRHDGTDRDVVELADVARRALRYRLRTTATTPTPEVAALLAAVDALLDAPLDEDHRPAPRHDPVLAGAHADRRLRRDVDL